MHDARVALSGRNQIFAEKLYAIRPHILVLNKIDLIDMKKYKYIKKCIAQCEQVLYLGYRLKIIIEVKVCKTLFGQIVGSVFRRL